MTLVTNSEFRQHLAEQLVFLEHSLKNYSRNEAEAKRAATVVAILLYDPDNKSGYQSKTKSLMFSHLNKKDIEFIETKAPKGEMFGFHINPGKNKSNLRILTYEEITNLVNPYMGLVAKELMEVNGKVILRYVPLFMYDNELSNQVHAPMIDNFPWGFGTPKEVVKRGFVDFDSWWNSTIYEDDAGYKLTRKKLILNIRNTDGGSHIDDQLDDTYAKLKKKDLLTMNIDGNFQHFNNFPAYPSAIQIAWETFVSIKRFLTDNSL